MKLLSVTFLASLLASGQFASCQLSGTVGPLTTRASKLAVKVCNILDYGGTASMTSDVGPPLASAFADCSSGGTVYVPPGNYGIATWATLSGGSAWTLQLDGILYRNSTENSAGTMISIADTTDFELYSSTSAGAIQGYGYVFHAEGVYGPRILRLTNVTDFSIHDIALVDAGAFHIVLDSCANGEVYNTIIRGGNEGGLDGIDVWGTNIWVHDVEVTNKDECVTSPASNILVENIYCNWSGGCAIGSLGSDTAISSVTYENIYTWESNQMLLIKSNGGNGTVSNCNFNNFIGHSNAYSLEIDAFWTEETLVAGDGVLYTNLTFNNWTGTCADGVQRGPIQVLCPTDQPCDDITITDFAMWTDTGNEEYFICENAWGSGGCLPDGTEHTAYDAITSTITATPSGFSAATMPSDLASGFPLTASIPIPAIPTTFFPGATPISTLLG